MNYIQEKIIQKSWDLVKWLWGDFKIQISIILCIITPRIITQKHRRSQKWRSCHFGPGFANLFEGTVFKESKDCWVATMYYTNQSTEKIIGLSDRTGNLKVWIPPPCVLLLKYSGLLFFYDLWKKDNILYPTVVGLRMISINLLNASHIVGFQ